MRTSLAYLDSSALVKLVVDEPESAALQRFVRDRNLSSSALARTQMVRAMRRLGPPEVERSRALLREVGLIAVDDQILDSAAMLDPIHLRTLDAIHLASALALGDALDSIVTYDERMSEAVLLLGRAVDAPT